VIRVNRAQAIAEIGRLQQVLERLAYVPRRTAEIAAPKITKLLRAQFRAGRDPYGRSWRPLKPSTLRKHGPPPLTDSGQLASGTKATIARSNYAGIRILVGRGYGYFHQVGFRVGHTRVAPRRILPQFGLPAEWRKVLDDSSRQAARQATRRVA
jgi:hypothetical protein